MNAKKGLDRRGFIIGGGAALAAAGCSFFRPRTQTGPVSLPAVGTWPWPENGLDPVETAGAQATGLSGCAVVSFGLIANRLKEALPGSAWPVLPPQLASFGNGGGPYGSDCGALQGPLLIMTLLGAPSTLKQEFYKWYCEFPFPSAEWDHLYPVKGTVTTVSNSPLCHESRAVWEGVFLREVYDGTNYDNTRCSKLPRDCAKKAVQLINAWKATGYKGEWAPGEGFKACYDCHTQLYRDKQPGGIHSGKEDCVPCHAAVPEHGEAPPPEGR